MEEKENRSLKDLISKISHPLLEIRTRSLRSIIFKLRNNIIHSSDLVKETSLLASLLEWFNFDEWALESQVLDLLSELSQHEAAVQTLVDLGGVEFLSQLRLHCDPSLHPLIDEILENIMMLPSNLVGLTPQGNSTVPSSSTSRLTADTTSDIGSYTPTCRATVDLKSNITGDAEALYPPPQHPEQSTPKESAPLQLSSGVNVISTDASTVRPCLVGTDAQCGLPTGTGTFGVVSHGSCQEGGHPPLPAQQGDNWDGGGVFPWLLLSTTDHHIIATTTHRLQSVDHSKLSQCCNFIHDVLLQDYPPELFLQRPAITKSLMSLLQHNGNYSIQVLVLKCLQLLTSRLTMRLAAHLQPALRISDRVTTGRLLVGNLTAAPQGLSDDTESWLHDLENFSPEILSHLYQEQLPLSQYCSQITEHTCLFLLKCINNDFQLLNCDDDNNQIVQCVSTCILLLNEVALLLSQVSMFTADTLESNFLEHINRTVECIGSALSNCLSKWRRATLRGNTSSFTTASVILCTPMAHQMVTLVTVHLAYTLSTIISILPGNATLPSAVGGALCDLVMNGLLSVTYPNLVQSLLPYTKEVDPPTYQLRVKLQSYMDSFQGMFNFLMSFRAKEAINSEMLSLAEHGLQGLYFECDEEFISSTVKLCIIVLVEHNEQDCQTAAHRLLLLLLSHGSFAVQRLALDHLHASLTSPVGSGAIDYLLENILQELCTDSLLSTDDTVSSACGKVLAHLLIQGGKKALQCLLPWQLYIEAGTASSTELATAMHNILTTEEVWSDTVKVQYLLRNMLLKNRDCRVWAFSNLSKFLIAAPSGKVSPFSVDPCAVLHDVLVLGKPTVHEQDIGQHSVFTEEDVAKLMHILKSPTMDHVLKTSAIEQLAIVLLDHSLHNSALEEDVVSSVNNMLSYCLNDTLLSDHQPTGVSPIRLFKSCVRSLGLVAYSSEPARRQLAGNKEFLLDILRGALLWHTDVELLYDASKLLCFLLFEAVAQYSKPTQGCGLKLPEGFVKRLQLPFPVDTYATQSPSKLPMILETEICASDPVHNMLQLAYHMSKVGGVGALLSHVSTSKEEALLSQSEVLMLKTLDCEIAFKDTSHRVKEIGDHWKEVVDQLSMLELIGGLSRKGCGVELNWEEALQGFLSMQPTNFAEEHILENVLVFLCTLVTSISPSESEWIVRATMDPQTVCFKLMQASLQEHSDRQPQKSLLKLYGNLLEKSIAIPFLYIPGLVKMFCRCLDVAGSPKYYDLPLLELSLHCVLHLSRIAMLKESSHEWLDCHMSVMTALRQVLCSFLVGRSSAGTASFMGKGISAKAAVALAHFLHSVKFQNPPQGWCSLWLNDPVCAGLWWLLSLLKDRDPHVQYGGFSILSLFCSEVDTAQVVIEEFANCTTYGIWGECLKVGLDISESALVRQQAIGVITSLVVLCSECKKWENFMALSLPQGTVKGPRALRILVDHYNLFGSFKVMLPGTEYLQSLKKSCQECCARSKAAFPEAATLLINETLTLYDPYTIWSISELLYNLVLPFPQYVTSHVLKQGMLKHFVSILNCEVLQFIIVAHSSGLIRLATFGSWLSMFEAIMILLRSLLLLHPEEILPHLFREEHVGSLCRMIPCLTTLILSKKSGVGLCTSLMALLHVINHKASSQQWAMLFNTIQLQWSSFVTLIQHTLENLKDEAVQLLAFETLKLFSLFICISYKPSVQTNHASDPIQDACLGALKELLDGNCTKSVEAPTSVDGALTDGRRLCEALLRAHDELPSPVRLHPVMSALSLLVACSSTAKQSALECGLLESSIDQLQVLHKRLSTEAIKQPSSRREESPHIAELISVVTLIRNLLYRSCDSKAAALSSHLPAAVQRIWPWCCSSRRLLVSVIQLLCVFCAQHSAACATLSTGLLPSILRQITRSLGGMSPSANSLSVNGNVLKAAFALLATTALSSECRAVMKKVGFLQSLSQLNPRAEKGNYCKVRPSCLWIKLLVNLSFSSEGQSMILKTPGSLDFLMGLYWNGGGAEQTQCLLVLRNLCFHQQSKTILSTTETVATLFSCALDSGASQQLALAASGIWALIFNCSKVKNSLKRSGLDKKLEQANLSCKAAGFKDNPQLSLTLSTALNLLQ